MGKIWTTVLYIVVMAAVLVAAYLATRFLAQRGKKLSSRHIRLRDSVMIGRDRHLAIVEAGDKTLLIGITGQSINALAELDPKALEQDDVSLPGQGAKGAAGFLSRLRGAPEALAKARAEARRSRRKHIEDEEDYLSMMDEAIKRRINRDFDRSGRDE